MIILSAKITNTDETVNITVDKRNMLSINSPTAYKSNLAKPDYGVLSMSGRIEFIDYDGKIEQLANDLLLVEGLKAEIFLNNTLTRKSTRVGEWETGKWNYDTNAKTVSVVINDGLLKWQEIEVPRVNYDAKSGQTSTLLEFYDYLYGITIQNGYQMVSHDNLDKATLDILNTTIIYPYLESGNLWRCWQKLAVAAQSYVFKSQSGVITFKYDEGA